MFRRRRTRPDDGPVAEPDGLDLDAESESAAESAAESADPRGNGPWDVSEIDAADLAEHVDLGGIFLPGREGMELRIDWDQATGTVNSVTIVVGASALQVQPFAAPRREGIWDDVRAEIAAGITQEGGVATEKDGGLGVELHARVPTKAPDGSPGVQLARFVGVDGPRWFLRGVLTGDAYADAEASAPLEEIFRGIVIVRGNEPMAPREPITLRLPPDAAGAPGPDGGGPEAAQKPPLEPFERGPEITEVH